MKPNRSAWQAGVMLVVATVAAGQAAVATAAAPDGGRRPNIVFVMADDLGWTDLGCQGSGYYETPAIDRLATQGVRFTNHHHCQNCTPTRAAILGGQYPARTGVYTVGDTSRFDTSMRPLRPVPNLTKLPLDRETIADRLKAAGYATGMFGKWHIGEKAAYHPSARGFDEAIVSMGQHFKFRTNPETEHRQGEYLADFISDRAVDFIARHRQKPFFLYVPHFAVHKPLEAKPKLVERFRDKPAVGGHGNATYAAMIAAVDQSVGRIIRALEEQGLTDNTVLIFTSDNGGVGGYAREGLGKSDDDGLDVTDNAPLRSGKGSLYEGGLRVPLIVRWPGVTPPGTTCGTPTLHVDFFPTLLEITGARPPRQRLDGTSLVGLLRDPSSKLERDAIFHHFPGYLGLGRDVWRTTPVSVVQAGDWKLLEYLEDGRLELYDLAADVGETRNRAADEPERAAELRRRLSTWRTSVGAAMPEARPASATARRSGNQPQERPAAAGSTPGR